jgi:hypothetical protein
VTRPTRVCWAYLNRAFKKYVGTPPRRATKGPNSILQGSDDVRFGSLADIADALPNVRFTLESGHRMLASAAQRCLATVKP